MIDNLSKLIQEAHANSVKHGFWGAWGSYKSGVTPGVAAACLTCGAEAWFSNKPGTERTDCISCGAIDDPTQRDLPTKISLLHSELSEALEEFRLGDEKRGGKLGELLYACPNGVTGRTTDDSRAHGTHDSVKCPRREGKAHKPEGFVTELADLAIRLFDLSGWLGWSLHCTDTEYTPLPALIPAAISKLHYEVARIGWMVEQGWVDGRTQAYAELLLSSINLLAERVEGNLQEAIEIKMRYNATRPMRHGKVV